MHCRWQTAGHGPAIGGFTPPSPFGQGQSGCPRGIFEKRRSRSAGILAALFVAAVPASAQAAACDSTMMALMYLGGSVALPPDTIFAPAQAVADAAGALCEGMPMPYFPAPNP
jgi:hypothetical protein